MYPFGADYFICCLPSTSTPYPACFVSSLCAPGGQPLWTTVAPLAPRLLVELSKWEVLAKKRSECKRREVSEYLFLFPLPQPHSPLSAPLQLFQCLHSSAATASIAQLFNNATSYQASVTPLHSLFLLASGRW